MTTTGSNEVLITTSELLAGLARGWEICYVPDAKIFLIMPGKTKQQCQHWLPVNQIILGCPVRISSSCLKGSQ